MAHQICGVLYNPSTTKHGGTSSSTLPMTTSLIHSNSLPTFFETLWRHDGLVVSAMGFLLQCQWFESWGRIYEVLYPKFLCNSVCCSFNTVGIDNKQYLGCFMNPASGLYHHVLSLDKKRYSTLWLSTQVYKINGYRQPLEKP